jgi:hypothetical protein
MQTWLNDDVKVEGPIYQREQDIVIKPEQHLIIQFDSGEGGFTVK